MRLTTLRFSAYALLVHLQAVSILAFSSPLRVVSKCQKISRCQQHDHGKAYRTRFMTTVSAKEDKNDQEYWLKEFATSTGEVVEPYTILGVRREATTGDIKQAYRTLSRKYHPDGMRFRTILPGSCNNVDEVRDQWERIKLSYEILSRPKMRQRYDRKKFMADPAAAVQRAAVDAAFHGAVTVGKGLSQGVFKVGAFALQQLTKRPDPAAKESVLRTVNTTNDGIVSVLDQKVRCHAGSAVAHSDVDIGNDNSEPVVLLTLETTEPENKPRETDAPGTRTRTTGRGFAKREKKIQ